MLLDLGGEGVFGKAGAGDHPGAHGGGKGLALGGRGAAQLFGGVGTDDAGGEGVAEDEGLVVDELVGGAAEGNAERGAGGLGLDHGSFRIGSAWVCTLDGARFIGRKGGSPVAFPEAQWLA